MYVTTRTDLYVYPINATRKQRKQGTKQPESSLHQREQVKLNIDQRFVVKQTMKPAQDTYSNPLSVVETIDIIIYSHFVYVGECLRFPREVLYTAPIGSSHVGFE